MQRRKTILTVSCFTLVLLASAACGGGNGQDAGSYKESKQYKTLTKSPPKAGVVPAGALDGITMTFVGFGGDPQKVQMNILEEFKKTSGADLRGDAPSGVAKIKAQVESGNVSWDVANIDSVEAAANCDVLMAPDTDIIDASALPEGLELGKCGVPGDITGNVLAYNVDKFGKKAPSSWADFFDTARFPGKRGMDGSNPAGVFEAALLADGVAPKDLYPLDTKRALAKLDTIKDQLVYWTSGAEQQQMIESGQVDMGFMWSGRVFERDGDGCKLGCSPPAAHPGCLRVGGPEEGAQSCGIDGSDQLLAGQGAKREVHRGHLLPGPQQKLEAGAQQKRGKGLRDRGPVHRPSIYQLRVLGQELDQAGRCLHQLDQWLRSPPPQLLRSPPPSGRGH